MGPVAMGVRGPTLFLVSAALLAFEVILLRVFAIETFHHFAYMAIGIALLGFGASGTLLVLARPRIEGREDDLFRWACLLLPLALLAAPALGHRVGFEPTQLLWDWRPWVGLAVLYFVLTIPFFIGATAISLALMRAGGSTGRLYAWSMAGSGLGGLGALALLVALPPDRALAATALVALPPAWGGIRPRSSHPHGALRGAMALAITAAVLVAAAHPPWALRITTFKGLPQVLSFPGAERVADAWGPTGWATAVRAPAFRHAPGMSLASPTPLPDQVALFLDGETVGAATSRTADLSFLEWLPSSAPYAMLDPASVLVLGSGDGLEVLNALAHGAERVTAVELVGPLVETTDRVLPPEGRIYADPRVRAVIGDARSYAARTDERFDLVVMATSGTFSLGASGIHGTGESYLETVEAYRSFLDLLEPGGVLAITKWLRAPPRDNVKLIFTVAEALRQAHGEPSKNRLAFLRSWSTGTLLVRPVGFPPEMIARLAAFADERLFDLDELPGPAGSRAGPGPAAADHNLLERPVFREALAAVAGGPSDTERFLRSYPFDVRPATDDRPYFGQFLHLRTVPLLLQEDRGAWLPVAEWGYLAVLATLVQSGLLAMLLLGAPVLALARPRREGEVRVTRTALYFAAIGFGFMLLELAAIQRLVLVLGHPVLAAAAALAVLLVFSGVGSALSDRLPEARVGLACALVALVGLVGAVLAPHAGALSSLPLGARASVGVAVLAVPGLLMGAPFPMGLRRLAPRPTGVAWAWAANGTASVLAASIATLLAVEVGSRGMLLAGASCYGTAALLGATWSRSAAEGPAPDGRGPHGGPA